MGSDIRNGDKRNVSVIEIPRDALYELINAMSGFATNATACGACEMGNRIARDALARFAERTGVTADEAYYGRRKAAPISST